MFVILSSAIIGTVTKVSIILRDDSGRYAWNAELDYSITPYVEPPCEDKLKPPVDKPPLEVEVDEGLLTTLQTFLGESEKKLQQKILSYCDRTVANEDRALKAKHYG